MTQPRRVLPGDTVMVTRRTIRRHHLFRPDSAIRQLYVYTLAICARQFGILVHAVTLMSTHEHLIVTDTKVAEEIRPTLPQTRRALADSAVVS